MAQFEQHFVQDLTQPIKVRHCGSIVFNADNESNVVSVRLFNGSEPVAISGSVVGSVICPDGATVPLMGSYSGNTASVTLTGDCFAVLGQIGVGIQIVNGTQKTTVLKAIYNVETLTTENEVDPGSRITLEVGDLIAAIDEAVATIPEDYTALTAEVENIKAVNKIFNRDVVGVPNPIDTATWIDNANLNDSGATKAAQDWKVTEGYIETSADSYKISYNNSETLYIVQVAGYTSNGSFVRMFANAESSSGVRSFTIDTTSVDKIRIATRYGNPILSVYPNDGKIVEKLASVEDDVGDLKSHLSFYDFGIFNGRIDWDTINNTVTLGTGFFIYGGGYARISSATTLAYTNFNNTTALVYNGSAFSFVPFNGLINGTALALFNVNKMYTPFSYDNVYLNGNKITTANLLNDFVPFIDSVNQDVDSINTEIEAINGKLDAFFPETVVYDENNVTSSNATSDNIWIPKELTIPANVIVTTIDVYVKNNTQKTFSVSFWNSETGEKYVDKTYTLTPNQNVVSIPINIQTTAPTKIGFYSASAFETVTGKNGYSLLYVDPSATSILNASTLAKWALNATIKAIVADQNDTRVLSQEIHVGEGLAYTEIQQAIEAVTGDYATIIVHPKSTPYGRFSLMRSLSGSYPWSGLASVKHISIIGVDKTKCIVQSNTGNYNTPPAEIATNGVIKNLTFIATHTASDGTETTGSYAVHVDNRPADTNGMKLVFENCDFISYQTAAVGLGLYKNQDILFDRCNFQSHTDPTWKPSENYDSAYMCRLGAYFMHTTMGYAGGNMFIRFRDCFFHHTGGTYAMVINDGDSEKTAYLEAINNTLYCDGTLVSNNMMLRPWNHGNNADAINAS